MAVDGADLVRRLWQYCNVLRDDGLSYPDYVEQLTYLLFLKMADEVNEGPVPDGLGWRSLAGLGTKAMHEQYSRILSGLGSRGGMLGLIFQNSRNKIRDPAKLRLLVVDLIGRTEWSGLSTDVKGAAYEGLLEKNARDTKSGAGQYFTPRPLIDAIVECVNPTPYEVVLDPACGTGGFLLSAHHHMRRQAGMRAFGGRRASVRGIRGVELVEEVARLATMNLLLHGITDDKDDGLPIVCADSLRRPPSALVDVVLTNPPFGVKGSVIYADGGRRNRGDSDLAAVRPDFWVQTANKQLNFLQHVATLLKPGGRAAVVIPDNVLFETGAAAIIRRRLLRDFDVHTLLRLPRGLFYAQGVKANVIFFDRPARQRAAHPHGLRVYDLRSNNRFSLKTRPLQGSDLQEFVDLYRLPAADTPHRRWRAFAIDRILGSEDCNLDLAWATTASAPSAEGALRRLDHLGQLIAEDLQRALAQISRASSGT